MNKRRMCLLVVVIVGAIFLSGCFEKEPGPETDEPLPTVTPQITTPVPTTEPTATVKPTATARPVTRPPLAMIGSTKAEFSLRSGDIEYSIDVIIQNTGKTPITFDSVGAFFYDQEGGFVTIMETGPVTLKPSLAITQHFESCNAYQSMENVEAAGKKTIVLYVYLMNDEKIVGVCSTSLPPLDYLEERQGENFLLEFAFEGAPPSLDLY